MTPSTPADRDGFVVWFEGLAGSGKTTISRATAARLRSQGWKVEVLDGDEFRHTLSPELGFSRRDRETNARRVSYMAHLLARNGVAVMVAMITPYETSRQAARSEVGPRFDEVWLKCTIDVCRQRDPKGIYRRVEQGSVQHVTGVDDPFEEPLNPDLTVDTSAASVDEVTQKVIQHLGDRGWVPAPRA
jgi:adenylylsulfate kinase